jgi:exopolyphosphatase/guanosine-5'-triphosphate,3'-diphosphate pyrophosphatase
LKFAAIDIGSNGVRLLISRPLELNTPYPQFKKVEFTRLPLRLGDDVFKNKEISKKKADLLSKSIKAFSLLMEVYNVDRFRACATSAMRDSKNAAKIIKRIQDESGIEIEVISGLEESKLIINSFLHLLDKKSNYIHIDVGGGSTEISHIKNGIVHTSQSFNIGTVRMRENKVRVKDLEDLKFWVKDYFKKLKNLKAIGTGGSISKLYSFSGVYDGEFLTLEQLKDTTNRIRSFDHNYRVYTLQMNPDRAEVIDIAGDIYTMAMQLAGASEIIAPSKGLKDGILQDLWSRFYSSKS